MNLDNQIGVQQKGTTMINNWSDVKHDPDMRVAYHYNNFQELVDSAEEISRDILNSANTVEDKAKAQVMRLILDGMVKCFDQFYCDVNQGFPGYSHATWQPADAETIKITQNELSMMYDALEYAKGQIEDSYIPVFDIYKEDGAYDSAAVTKASSEATKLMDKIELISCNDAGSLVLSK